MERMLEVSVAVIFLNPINNSSSLNKENHNREGGLDTRS